MILALGLRLPILPWWVAGLMLAAVASRYIHALGILSGGSVYEANLMKSVGAVGTYLTGIIAFDISGHARGAALFLKAAPERRAVVTYRRYAHVWLSSGSGLMFALRDRGDMILQTWL